jgi:hypothetical protein
VFSQTTFDKELDALPARTKTGLVRHPLGQQGPELRERRGKPQRRLGDRCQCNYRSDLDDRRECALTEEQFYSRAAFAPGLRPKRYILDADNHDKHIFDLATLGQNT